MLAGMLTAPAFAQGQNNWNSELSIGMANNTKFTMSFDNSYYATPSNTYNITAVQPGNHRVTMRSVPTQFYGTYSIPQILFDGWVNIPAGSKVTAYAMNLTQLNIASIVPLAPQNVYYDPNNPYYGYGNGGYGNGNGGYNNGAGCGNGNNGGYGNYGGYGNTGGWYPPPPQPVMGMLAADFATLKNSINNQSFDSDKLSIAKQALNANHVTSQQALELMKLLTFESTKVEFAKLAYGKTVDRNNYYVVNDGFTFSSSVTELSNYINSWHA